MNDFPTWIKKKGMKFALQRRKLYRIRHSKDRFSGNGKWADRLLW